MENMRRIAAGRVVKAYEIKERDESGGEVPTGIVEGYLATWDVDRAGDQFVRGAFGRSIAALREKGRPLRLKRQHWQLIGGFDPESLREDEKGLYGVASINLLVQQGAEAYALAKQGVLSDFSVGVSVSRADVEVLDDDRMMIRQAELWEASLVDEPMNERAVATLVRSAETFPAAAVDAEWYPAQAIERVRALAEQSGDPATVYGRAFLSRDVDADPNRVESYRLPVCDVIDGELQIVRSALTMTAAQLDGARGGVSLADDERVAIAQSLDELCKRASIESPITKGVYDLSDLARLPKSVAGDILRSKRLSRRAVDAIVDMLHATPATGTATQDDDETIDSAIDMLRDYESQREAAELAEILRRGFQ